MSSDPTALLISAMVPVLEVEAEVALVVGLDNKRTRQQGKDDVLFFNKILFG